MKNILLLLAILCVSCAESTKESSIKSQEASSNRSIPTACLDGFLDFNKITEEHKLVYTTQEIFDLSTYSPLEDPEGYVSQIIYADEYTSILMWDYGENSSIERINHHSKERSLFNISEEQGHLSNAIYVKEEQQIYYANELKEIWKLDENFNASLVSTLEHPIKSIAFHSASERFLIFFPYFSPSNVHDRIIVYDQNWQFFNDHSMNSLPVDPNRAYSSRYYLHTDELGQVYFKSLSENVVLNYQNDDAFNPFFDFSEHSEDLSILNYFVSSSWIIWPEFVQNRFYMHYYHRPTNQSYRFHRSKQIENWVGDFPLVHISPIGITNEGKMLGIEPKKSIDLMKSHLDMSLDIMAPLSNLQGTCLFYQNFDLGFLQRNADVCPSTN